MSPEPGEHLVFAILLSVVCLFLYGWFSAAESAFQHANERQLRRLSASNLRAQKAVRHMERQPRLLSTLAWMTLLAGFLSAGFLSWSIAPALGSALSFLPFSAAVHRGIAIALVELGLAFVFLIVGNLIPRKIAAAKPEVSAMRTAGLVHLFAALFRPVTAHTLVQWLGQGYGPQSPRVGQASHGGRNPDDGGRKRGERQH